MPPFATPLALFGYRRVRRYRHRGSWRGPFHVKQGVPETSHIMAVTHDNPEEALEVLSPSLTLTRAGDMSSLLI